jgi:DNA end-binding protein Ku
VAPRSPKRNHVRRPRKKRAEPATAADSKTSALLREYSAKRALDATPEPPPHIAAGTGPLLFVVQQHAARRLHYDFRLELDGVLKSWAVPKDRTQIAEITAFVPLESVDPVYFDKASYLGPDKGGAKSYALLAKALRESHRCALGRRAARGKQYIVMLRPIEDGLVMQQLLYAAEVRPIGEIDIPKTEVKDAELKLARQLIDQQAADAFDPAAYKDEVRERIEAAVQRKVEGQEITMTEAVAEGGAQIIDLMEALRASLGKKAAAPAAKAPAPEHAATRKPPKRAPASPSTAKAGKKARE